MEKFNDKFYPTDLKSLLKIFLEGLKKGEILSYPKELIFRPKENDFFKTTYLNQKLASPIGVAAGPHTQLAQNIVIAWLMGARFIELKTVQHLDELEISKPCIDMEDEGYNVEWSQELKIKQSVNEYVNAWILIHILAHELGFSHIETIFNMSVGYDFQGIQKENVQWFLNTMVNAKEIIEEKINQIQDIYPKIKEIEIPYQITNNITLSTMHGTPPDEVEKIAEYLLVEKNLNTIIKLNPTLLGPERVRNILKSLNYTTEVPDIAFEHDLKFDQAVNIVQRLLEKAEEKNLFFGIKLTNTLESKNNKEFFDKENEMMYMSGRALHPISINLAYEFAKIFGSRLKISFSAGVDAFNIADVMACGLKPITVSSDLLKPGGYGRLAQYYENLRNLTQKFNLKNIDDWISTKANTKDLEKAYLKNLKNYANEVLENKKYFKKSFGFLNVKTNKNLDKFDCITAPCKETCPTNQDVPQYMYLVSEGRFSEAFETVMSDNPFPFSTGYSCDHTCQYKCTRINYDSSLNIREIKRFIAEYGSENFSTKIYPQPKTASVGIIGGGAAGLSAAYFLKKYGFEVEIYEKSEELGGMVKKAIPQFRISDEQVEKDIKRILDLGIKVHYNFKVNSQNIEVLRYKHKYLVVSAGAMKPLPLEMEGIKALNVFNPFEFFFNTRKKIYPKLGKKIGVIGGGNTAIDAARIAKRIAGEQAEVYIFYRRTIRDMPAYDVEIFDAIEEGIKIVELVSPVKIITDDNNYLKAVKFIKNKVVGRKNGRSVIEPIENEYVTYELDSLIPSIGQDIDFEFLKKDDWDKNQIPKTKHENIYITGDAARFGHSIIAAIADGKNAAYDIIKRENPDFKPVKFKVEKHFDLKELKLKKYKRVLPVEPKTENNLDFEIIFKTYTPEQAKEEALRCLLCDEYCSTCNTVCPNLANQTYILTNLKFPKFLLENGKIVRTQDFVLTQKYQTFNIADWCNECGNCATFCPTSGRPYMDKPKIHISEQSYKNSPFGYMKKGNVLYYKTADGKEHQLIFNDFTIEFISEQTKIKLSQFYDIMEYDVNPEKEANLNILTEMLIINKIFEQFEELSIK